MASKLFLIASLAVCARAGYIPQHDLSSHGQVDYASAGHLDLSSHQQFSGHGQELAEHDLSAYAEFGHGDHEPTDYHSHPRYEFSYGVKDEHTGDEKTHEETRDGGTVRGSYSVVDPDGHKRIVDYTADDHNGFKAVVRREKIDNFQGAQHYDNSHAFEALPHQSYDAHGSYH